MSASHRKFGDLLQEGIKRVHIVQKKPIGLILDEFGYELRPDDLTKGRYALGHWYYKKRIPANMEDVAILAQLIVKSSDVDRAWLKKFLSSAGFPETDRFCDQFFSPGHEISASVFEQASQDQGNSVTPKNTLNNSTTIFRWAYAVITLGVLIALLVFYSIRNGSIRGIVNEIETAVPSTSQIKTLKTDAPDSSKATQNFIFPPTPVLPTVSPISFNAICPEILPTAGFKYVSFQSFKDFLNLGASPALLQSVFTELVQKQDEIRDGKVSVVDLTGDGVDEVIVNAILENGSFLEVMGCHDGQYQDMVNLLETSPRYLRFVVDLNGNRLPEIVSYLQTQSENNVPTFEFSIQEWDGRVFRELMDNSRFTEVGMRLPSDVTDWSRTISRASVTTRDVNGDRLYELIITGGLVSLTSTCETRFEREFVETWTWYGDSFQLLDRTYIPPIYRFQRAADGDLAFALGNLEVALTAYQDVLFDNNLYSHDQYLSHLEYCRTMSNGDTLIMNEQAQLMAYARWRILLINAIGGAGDAAEVVYQTLQDKFPKGEPGHSYAEIATAFWEQYQIANDLEDACQAVGKSAVALELYPGHEIDNLCYIP